MRTNFTPSRYAYYIPEQVDVKLVSSYADTSGYIAKRYIYEGLSRANGHTGALGFFDIHNEGTMDSPEVEVKFTFNTDNDDKAKYYVTRVNLPVYGNAQGTTVQFVLENDEGQTVSGTKKYTNTSSFACQVAELRSAASVDYTYYIKSLSYQTKLQKGINYHAETAHLHRNRVADSGLFSGYIEGALNSEAKAVMSIQAAEGSTAITSDGKVALSATEKSTVSDQDYIAYTLNEIKLNTNQTSQSITAGNSTTISFGATISNEEYARSGTNQVNGYHVFRDGIFYMCLPDGVSIPGKEQGTIRSNGTTIEAKSIEKLENAEVTVGNVKAYWWKIEADGLNTIGGAAFSVEVQLATSEKMAGLTWNFQNCIAVRPKNQIASWGAAGTLNNVYNATTEMQGSSSETTKALAAYLAGNNETMGLGMNMYNGSVNARLTIARAEAKLAVTTVLKSGSDTAQQSNISISDETQEVLYQIDISSTDGGHAENFYYYIPVVKKESILDKDALISENEYGMKLLSEIQVQTIKQAEKKDVPFQIAYTTDESLNSTSIQGTEVNWQESVSDYSQVTAVRISTKANSTVESGDEYLVTVPLQYDNSNEDFAKMAGTQVQWRSFGHYTYNRNGAATTNTYPSGTNSVTVQYKKDLTGSPTTIELDTGADVNLTSQKIATSVSFIKDQSMKVKHVTVSSGTQLIESSPNNLTGADANSQFQMMFGINLGSKIILSGTEPTAIWDLSSNEELSIQVEVAFQKL